jgi:hypothetical protein
MVTRHAKGRFVLICTLLVLLACFTIILSDFLDLKVPMVTQLPLRPALLLSGLSLLIAYFERNWLRALLQFKILGRDIEVVSIQMRDKHVDIGSDGLKDELDKSRGVKIDELQSTSKNFGGVSTSWIRTVRQNILTKIPFGDYETLSSDASSDGTPTVRVECGQC